MKLTHFILLVLSLIALSLISYLSAYYIVDPDCRVTIQSAEDGTKLLQVKPSFVVNSIGGVELFSGKQYLGSLERVAGSKQCFVLPRSLPSGSELNAMCTLQFDKLAPSTRTVSKHVVVP